MPKMICLRTQTFSYPDFTPYPGNTETEADRLAQGFRYPPVLPPVPDGCQRSAVVYAEAGDGKNAVAQYTDTPLAVLQAQQQAADAAAVTAASNAKAAAVAAVAQQAHIFRSILQKYFGAGAETNPVITQAAVQAYFVGLEQAGTVTAQNLADAEVLNTLFPVLTQITGDGTTWSFPWSEIP